MIDRKKVIIGLECLADPNPYMNTEVNKDG